LQLLQKCEQGMHQLIGWSSYRSISLNDRFVAQSVGRSITPPSTLPPTHPSTKPSIHPLICFSSPSSSESVLQPEMLHTCFSKSGGFSIKNRFQEPEINPNRIPVFKSHPKGSSKVIVVLTISTNAENSVGLRGRCTDTTRNITMSWSRSPDDAQRQSNQRQLRIPKRLPSF